MTTTSLELRPARLFRGRLGVPGDKSISHRYAMLAALARGATTLTHIAPGADVASTLRCLASLGTRIDRLDATAVRIHGASSGMLAPPEAPLDAGNSGTTMRLLMGVLAGQAFSARLDGDASLRRRPMRRVIEPLTAMGARVTATDGRPPLDVTGAPLRAIEWTPAVASAQVKSAILLAGLAATGRTTVLEPLPTRDHTERAFTLFGIAHDSRPGRASLVGPQCPTAPPGTLHVPGDPSSAAVWAAAAAALPGATVEIHGACLNPQRLGFARLLARMGADVTMTQEDTQGGESVGTIRVAYGAPRAAVVAPAEVPAVIDELPVLAAAAALGGGLEVSGAAELRVKESDRISALVAGFRLLGLDADERPDGFVIRGGQRPSGGRVDAAGDHRLVMAFTIVALGSSGPTTIDGADVVAISYPAFTADLERLATW